MKYLNSSSIQAADSSAMPAKGMSRRLSLQVKHVICSVLAILTLTFFSGAMAQAQQYGPLAEAPAVAAQADAASAPDTEVPVPALRSRLTDLTGTLTDAEKEALERKLYALEQSKGSQLVVLIIPTVGTQDTIETYARRVIDAWKIGRQGVDDGVLFLIAKNDKKMRIEPGYGLEGAITDLQASRIIRNNVAPHFKDEDFAGGIKAGVDALSALIQGEALPEPAKGAAQDDGELGSLWLFLGFGLLFFPPLFFFFVAFLLVQTVTGSFFLAVIVAVFGSLLRLLLASLFGRGHYRNGRRGGIGILPIGGFGGGRGGGFGGFGGGGGFSGGGGSSGGGGASGGW